jgi:hypothetical protein
MFICGILWIDYLLGQSSTVSIAIARCTLLDLNRDISREDKNSNPSDDGSRCVH